MSVRLIPAAVVHKPQYLNNPDPNYYEDDEYWSCQMSNGTWSRLDGLLNEAERPGRWNGCHDGHYYSPTQLTLIAMRAEGRDSEYYSEDLNQLARQGGCILE